MSDVRIFFVGGCANSGTTWVMRLLDAHPQVICRGEMHFTDILMPGIMKAMKDHNERQKVMAHALPSQLYTSDDVARVWRSATGLIYERWKAENPTATALGDKTPTYVRQLDSLDLVYPGMRFIHVIRDGRDVAVSRFYFRRRHGAEEYFDDGFISSVASEWSKTMRIAEQWGSQHPDRYLAIRYEDLTDRPLECAERMFGLLGADTASADSCIAASSFKAISGRERGQENPDSDYRKGTPGEWKAHFSDHDHRTFLGIAGKWISNLGYHEANEDGKETKLDQRRNQETGSLQGKGEACGNVDLRLRQESNAKAVEGIRENQEAGATCSNTPQTAQQDTITCEQ